MPSTGWIADKHQRAGLAIIAIERMLTDDTLCLLISLEFAVPCICQRNARCRISTSCAIYSENATSAHVVITLHILDLVMAVFVITCAFFGDINCTAKGASLEVRHTERKMSVARSTQLLASGYVHFADEYAPNSIDLARASISSAERRCSLLCSCKESTINLVFHLQATTGTLERSASGLVSVVSFG